MNFIEARFFEEYANDGKYILQESSELHVMGVLYVEWHGALPVFFKSCWTFLKNCISQRPLNVMK